MFKLLISLICCQVFLFYPDAYAQDSKTEHFQLEEMTVTIQKREEILQEIPAAITAFSSQQIEDASIQGVEDLSLLTPGFTYTNVLAGRVGNPIIRGANTIIGEANVGFFLDGIYQESRELMNVLLGDDIERIEIAKGPQSALYGRNTFSGAINYISKQPANENEGKLKLTIGNHGRKSAHLSHSGAITEDTLFYRAAIAHSSFDGFYKNELTGGELDDKQSNLYSLSLLALPSDNLEMTFRVAVDNTNDGDAALKFVENNAGFSSEQIAPPFPFIFNDFQVYKATLLSVTDKFAVTPGHYDRDNFTSSFRVDLDLEQVTFTSITGYNDLSIDSIYDSDYEARKISSSIEKTEQDEFSQEFRITSIDQPIRWMTGLYFYHLSKDSMTRDEFVSGASLGPLATVLSPNILSNSDSSTRNWAVFGSVGFDLTNKLGLTLSGRYAYERKEVDVVDTNLITSSTGRFKDNATFNHFTPKVILDYQITKNAMLYGSVAKAIKSGGFNTSTFGGRVPSVDERTFDEEKSMNYELGLKTSWLNNRVTANLAVFLIKWDDQIVRALGVNQAVLNDNAGESSSKGFELELAAKPAKNWDVTVGLSYTDAKYDKYTFDAMTIVGLDPVLDGNPMQYVSEWTANASVQYVKPFTVANFEWKSRLDVMYQTEQSSGFIDESPIIPERTIVNVRTGFDNKKYAITLWIKNVFDNEEPNSASTLPNSSEAADYLLTKPGFQQFQNLTQAPVERTFGLTASMAF